MAVLTLDDLSLAFRGVHVLDKVSRTIEPGEKIGLLGRNGTGKTTLLRLIAGSQEPDSGTCVLAGGKRASFLPQEVPVDMVGQVLEVVQEALLEVALRAVDYVDGVEMDGQAGPVDGVDQV